MGSLMFRFDFLTPPGFYWYRFRGAWALNWKSLRQYRHCPRWIFKDEFLRSAPNRDEVLRRTLTEISERFC